MRELVGSFREALGQLKHESEAVNSLLVQIEQALEADEPIGPICWRMALRASKLVEHIEQKKGHGTVYWEYWTAVMFHGTRIAVAENEVDAEEQRAVEERAEVRPFSAEVADGPDDRPQGVADLGQALVVSKPEDRGLTFEKALATIGAEGIVAALRALDVGVPPGLDIALDQIEKALASNTMAQIEIYLPMLERELELLPMRGLPDGLLRKLLRELLQPARDRVRAARKGWLVPLVASLAAVFLAFAGVNATLAIAYGPAGFLALLLSGHRTHKLDQLHSTAVALCQLASENIRELPAGR